MPEQQLPRVVFRVRVGKDAYTCRGHLVWEGGIVYAIPDPDDDSPFMPDRMRLEESDLELKRDDAGDYYEITGGDYRLGQWAEVVEAPSGP